MRPLRALLAVAALTAGFLAAPLPASADPVMYPCVGAPADEPNGGLYPERRVFVESQAQWVPGPNQADTPDTNQGHQHEAGCVPEQETLHASTDPNFTVWVRLVMFRNPGRLNYASMVFKTPSMETTVQKDYTATGMTCPAGECIRWVRFSWPLSAFDHSGLQEIRFRMFVNQSNGKQQNTSLNWQVYVDNGKSVSNVTRMPWLRGKGWYTHSLYCEGAYISVPIPKAPVSGVWSPVLRLDTHDSDASLPVTHYTVAVDPHGHADPPDPGIVLLDADGTRPSAPLAIDTMLLANGPHRLFLRSGCRDDSLGSTNWGVLVVPFIVQN